MSHISRLKYIWDVRRTSLRSQCLRSYFLRRTKWETDPEFRKWGSPEYYEGLSELCALPQIIVSCLSSVWSKTTLIHSFMVGAEWTLLLFKRGHFFNVLDTNWANFQQKISLYSGFSTTKINKVWGNIFFLELNQIWEFFIE